MLQHALNSPPDGLGTTQVGLITTWYLRNSGHRGLDRGPNTAHWPVTQYARQGHAVHLVSRPHGRNSLGTTWKWLGLAAPVEMVEPSHRSTRL